MKIGIICAMKIELEGLKKYIENAKEYEYTKSIYITGTVNNVEVVAVECGIGKVNATICTQVMIDNFNPDYIINSGIAGSLSSSVGIADIVISDKVVQHDMNMMAIGHKRGEISFNDEEKTYIYASDFLNEKLLKASSKLKDTKSVIGTVATGDIFVATVEKRHKISKEFNALACEMEGGAIGQTSYRNNIPFSVLRCISDDFEEKYFMDFDKFAVIASDKTISILTDFLNSF